MSDRRIPKSDHESRDGASVSSSEGSTWNLPDVLSDLPRIGRIRVGREEVPIATLSHEGSGILLDSLRASARASEHASERAQASAQTRGAPERRPAPDRVQGIEARIEILGATCERFLDPVDPLRREALQRLPGRAGLSAEGATHLLDRMAADWTRERLKETVAREFPTARPGDPFTAPDVTSGANMEAANRQAIPTASELVLTICSGTVPGVSVTAALRALLVGSSVLVKPGAGDVVLPVLFAQALRERSPELASRLAVVYWPGGDGGPLEEEALRRADRIVVYGGAETIRSVRIRGNPTARLIEYGHRVGVAIVGVDHGDERLAELANEVARAVVPYEQRGCVSPARVIAVGPEERAAEFTRAVARAMGRWANLIPSERSDEEEAAIHQLRTTLELRRAAGAEVMVESGAGWMVIRDESPEPLAGGRIVRINRIGAVDELKLESASDTLGTIPTLQAVGVAGLTPSQEAKIASGAALHGASRVSPVAEMAWPPAWWIQDGQGPLRVLVDWTEWERGPVSVPAKGPSPNAADASAESRGRIT